MDQITASLAAETPRWFTDRVAKVEPLHEFVTRGVRTWMVMLLGAVAFVLLIACVNLANLMLVRATARTRELGIRAALGASRWDLSRVLLLESLILSLAGAALGAAVAWWGVDVLRAAMPEEVPRAATIAVDLRVLAATGMLAILTGIGFGLAPVVQFSRPTVATALYQSERTTTASSRTKVLRATLVVAEVALAVVLLVGSGLFLASFARLINVDLGTGPSRRLDGSGARARGASRRTAGLAAQQSTASECAEPRPGDAWCGGRVTSRRWTAAQRQPAHREFRDSGPRATQEYRYRPESDFAGLLQGHQGTAVEGPVLYGRRQPEQRARRDSQRRRGSPVFRRRRRHR